MIRSVNSGIKKGFYLGQPFNFSLPSDSMLTNRLITIRPRCLAMGGGADLARAYRQLRVCPLSAPLLGIALINNIYIDIAPLFGCRPSAIAGAHTTCALV